MPGTVALSSVHLPSAPLVATKIWPSMAANPFDHGHNGCLTPFEQWCSGRSRGSSRTLPPERQRAAIASPEPRFPCETSLLIPHQGARWRGGSGLAGRDAKAAKRAKPRLVYSADGSLAFSMDQTIAPASSVTVTPSARVPTFASSTADGSLMQVCELRSRTGLGSKVHRSAGRAQAGGCWIGSSGAWLKRSNPSIYFRVGLPLVISLLAPTQGRVAHNARRLLAEVVKRSGCVSR